MDFSTATPSAHGGVEYPRSLAEKDDQNCTLYLSNLSVSTTDALEARFNTEPGFRTARVRSVRGSDTFIGFIEFDTNANAARCLRRAAGEVFRGKPLGAQQRSRRRRERGLCGRGPLTAPPRSPLLPARTAVVPGPFFPLPARPRPRPTTASRASHGTRAPEIEFAKARSSQPHRKRPRLEEEDASLRRAPLQSRQYGQQDARHFRGDGTEVPLPRGASTTLFVGNLPAAISERELSHIFRSLSGFVGVRLARATSNPHRIVAFVDFDTEVSATKALYERQNYLIDYRSTESNRLLIEFAKSAPAARDARHHDAPMTYRLDASSAASQCLAPEHGSVGSDTPIIDDLVEGTIRRRS